MPRARHRPLFWAVLIGTTAFLSIDPALFLVVAALALSALAVTSIVMLVHVLLVDALAGRPDTCALPRTPNNSEAGTR